MNFKKNDDGSLLLDGEGNPIIELTDEEKEAAREKESLVNELKELRSKNGLMKDLLGSQKETPQPPANPLPPEDEKIVSVVKQVLDSEKASSAQANKKAALEKFVAEHKEFSPENDPTGLKRDALQKKLNQFNTDGLYEVEEFLTVIGDARKLLVGNDSKPETSVNTIHLPNSPTPRSNPSAKPDDVLTPLEAKLAEQTGRTKEDILKMKLKHPDFLRDLLEHVRD